MAEVKTGHQDLADALTERQKVFNQIVSDLEQIRENPSPLIAKYTMSEFIKDKRSIQQARKEMKVDGEASHQEAQRGQTVEMSFLAKDYSVRSEFTKKWLRDASPEQIQEERLNISFAAVELLEKLFYIELLRRPTTSTTSGVTGWYYGQTDAPRYKANEFTSAHDHYVVTASSSAWASADLVTGRNHVTEHGYGVTNGGITIYGNQGVMDAYAGLSGFTDETITEEQQRDGVVGKMKGVLLVKDNWIPDDYGIFLPTIATPVAVYKQHNDPAYRGAMLSAGNNPADPLDGSKLEYNAIGMNTVLKGAGVVMYKGATWTQQTTLSVS
jgi:hypothetical protein